MNRKSAEDAAREYDKNLKCTDFYYDECVLVKHDDFTQCMFFSAFPLDYGPYILVFTEHHGYHVYHKDETLVWHMKSLPKKNYIDLNKDVCVDCGKELLISDLIYGIHPMHANGGVALCVKCKDADDEYCADMDK